VNTHTHMSTLKRTTNLYIYIYAETEPEVRLQFSEKALIDK
jgi:hypothetical protein